MKNHLLPFCLAVLLPALSFGQTVSYKVTEDDPTPKALGINLEPFFCEAGANSIYIGWEARANLDFKKLLSFQAAYRTSYGGMMRGLTGSTYELMVPVGGQIAPKYAEATGMFNFYNKQKERSLKVVLYSNSYTVGNTRYTNSKFIMVPGHVRRIWSLRGSLYTFANNFEVGENTEKYKESVTGSVFYGVNTKDNKDTVRWGAYGVNKNGSTLYDCYSVISGMVIAAGINSRTITNLWINADGYGRKGNRSQTEWYIDYQLAPVIALRNVVAKDGTEFDMKTASGVKKHTGWRAGMLMRGVRRPFMSFKCEMGQRPGLKQDLMGTFYINCSFGLSIPVKVKPFQYED